MSRRYELAIVVSLCAALFATCLVIYTQNNTFPYYNHHDEEHKVEQLLTRDFNFNHPHLLLLSTDIVRRARGQTDGYQNITLSGRWVSATFAAASVVLLTLVGWKAMGLLGAWCVGLLVAVCPIVGLTANFLKEDTALLLGFSASLLALLIWREKPSDKRLIWLGLACGLAASAKYIGALLLIVAALLVLAPAYRSQGMSRFRQLAPLLVPAALVFVAINWPMFLQLDSFIGGFSKGVNEISHIKKSVDLLNSVVIRRLTTLSWPVLFMALIGVLCLITAFRRSCLAGWVFFGTFILSTGIIMVTTLGVPSRYVLFPAVSLHALAGLAIAMLAQFASNQRGIKRETLRYRKGINLAAGIAAVMLTWTAVPVFQAKAIAAFENADPRAELIAWVNSSLDDGTKLAASRKIRLPGIDGREPADPAIRFEREPVTYRSRVDINPDTLQEMRSNGVTHLILREWEWSNYLAIHGSTPVKPVIVWRTPERFKTKNRWMRGNLVVLQL